MTLHELAANLSSRLCTAIEAEPDGKKERRIAFALEGLISTGYSMLVIFFVSLVLGTVKQTMAALLFAGSLRTFTGGVHARTPTRCALISGVVFGSLGLGVKYLPWPEGFLWNLTAFMVLATVILIFAPRETTNKKIPPAQRRLLRIWTVVLLLFFFFFLIYFLKTSNFLLTKALLLGMGWQALAVSPVLREKIEKRKEGE